MIPDETAATHPRLRGRVMFFLLRAVLVIGALTYFAAQRSGTSLSGGSLADRPVRDADLATAWTTLPAAARERIAREGAADLAARITAMQPSRDTLAEADRRPAWQGVAAR